MSLEPMWCWRGVEQGLCFRWVFTVTNKAQLAQPLWQHWFSNGVEWPFVGSWHWGGNANLFGWGGVLELSKGRKEKQRH